jgi:hypothetical protein
MTTERMDRIEKKLEKIDDLLMNVSVSVSRIEEHLEHVPTKSDMHKSIASHSVSCGIKRRWLLMLLLGLPATATAIAAVMKAL